MVINRYCVMFNQYCFKVKEAVSSLLLDSILISYSSKKRFFNRLNLSNLNEIIAHG